MTLKSLIEKWRFDNVDGRWDSACFSKVAWKIKNASSLLCIGTLLGATFFALLPEAIESTDPHIALQVVLAILFFILEKIIRLPHGHAHSSGHRHHDEQLKNRLQVLQQEY